MFNWIKKSKNKKQAGIVTNVHDVKEQSNVKVQNTNNSTAENIVCAEKITNSFKTEIHNYYTDKPKQDTTQSQLFNNLPPLDINFIGRTTELQKLNNALNSNQISIFCIIAAGGIGKTSLIQKWLGELNQTDYKIFAWSFYNQGANDDSQTSSIPFFNEAFKFFNYQGENIIDEQQRGRELATLIKTQNTILVLDGLEPLQHSPQADNGFLKDPAIDAFLTRILNEPLNDNSLILISTRQPLTRFIDKKYYKPINLSTLDEEFAIELLKNLGVTKGTKQEFIDAVNFYGCHALALMLLGRMLVNYFERDIRYYREIPLLEEETQGKHAEKVLNFYFNRWQDNEAEKLFLYLLGLFDRSMNEDEKTELFNKASIAQPLAQLSSLKLKQIIKCLRDLKLLSDDKDYYDCHPIIRNYFGLKFKENNYELFKQAHLVLFEYYQGIPKKELPSTLEEMLPLYRAVIHGCLAGKYKKTWEDIYKKRILHGKESYSWHKLGAYTQNSTALSFFFSTNYPLFDNSDLDLSNIELGRLLSELSFSLMSLGRLEDAVNSSKFAKNLSVQLEDWEYAARNTEVFIDTLTGLGKLYEVEKNALLAIDYSLHISDKWRLIANYSRLATVLYNFGQLQQSILIFIKAEQLVQPDCTYLYSIWGTKYCSALLDADSNNKNLSIILERGKYCLSYAIASNRWQSIAYGHFNMACIYSVLQETQKAHLAFSLAIQIMQRSNNILYIPSFYIARADFYLTQNKLNEAKDDLNSALEIIERCGMKLYQVDYLLIHGRYCLASNDNKIETALNNYQEAKDLIAETGYHLRDAELDLLAAQILRHAESKIMILDSKTADDYLQKAKNRIEEIGQWGLLRVIERDFS